LVYRGRTGRSRRRALLNVAAVDKLSA